jgi:serine/threonine protein kinase
MISDLGLTWRQDSVSTDKVFGVLPYIAPEILSGGQYSSASDIYSFAMIMYEIASGKVPFYHIDINPINIIKGSRPKLPPATPPTYIQLMKSCWDSDPKKRPSASFLVKALDDWMHSKREQLVTINNSFHNVEYERKNSITDNEEDDENHKMIEVSSMAFFTYHTEVLDSTESQILSYTSTINQTSQLISIK